MASSSLIATGVIHLDNGNTNLPFYIHSDGFYLLKDGRTPGKFFDQVTAGRTEKVRGEGHIVFTSLFTNFPSAPSGDSFSAKLEYSSSELKLTVEQKAEKSVQLPNAHFSRLKIILTQKKNGSLKVEDGGAMMELMGASLPLRASLEEGQLVFRLGVSSQDVKVPAIGTAHLSGVNIQTAPTRWGNLQVLYSFSETEGDLVYDNSGNSPGFNLKVKNGTINQGSGLSVTNNTEARTEMLADRIISDIEKEDAFTVELWVKPTGTRSRQPGTILALGNESGPAGKTFFSLNQDSQGKISVEGAFSTAPALVGPALRANQLAHIVFTRDKSGLERLYIDGGVQGARVIGSGINRLNDNSVILVLGNMPKRDHNWQGEYYSVAIYSRALSETEVNNPFRPDITMAGEFTIANAPAPLDTPLPASFDLLKDQASVVVKTTKKLSIRPELHFTNLHLQWLSSTPGQWTLSGKAEAAFWNNKTTLTAGMADGNPNVPLLAFASKETPVNIGLEDWGHLEFTSLSLKVSSAQDVIWDLSTSSDPPFTILPSIRFRAFDLMADFLLVEHQLRLTPDHLLLTGKWLGEPLTLQGSRRMKELVMIATAPFNMAFDYNIPPIFDSKTGEQLNDGAQLIQNSLNIELGLELSRNGLLTRVDSNFDWQDQDGVAQHSIIPTFTLYTPPPNKNAILGHIVEHLETNINELFERTGKQLAEYNLGLGADQPKIFLKAPQGVPLAQTETRLPGYFGSDFTSSPNGVFKLAKEGNGSKLILKPDKTPAEVDADYENLMQHLAEESVGLGAITLLQRRIAERLALPYDRLLYYYYGFTIDGQFSYLDLHPGMRLRIDFQNYQFVQASDQTARRGFTGTGSTYVQLASYSRKKKGDQGDTYHQVLGFDPFLSQLQTEGVLDIATAGAGGLFDLLKAENRKAAYRLFFPLNPATGPGPERVTTIVGADSLSDLNAATANFIQNASTPPEPGISFFFRGRTSITPEIQVFVRDQATYVPVGTTLRQLMQRFDDIPPAGIGQQDLSVFLQAAKPLRLLHEGMNSKPAYRFINLENAAAVNMMDVLDLPLIKGDRFYF